VENSSELAADRAFFARLGLAFAVSILVSGIMMVAVGPVAQEGEGPQIALSAVLAANQ
jgi:hypothetical protein